MEYLLVAIVVTTAVVIIVSDSVHQRRVRRARLDTRPILSSALSRPTTGPDVHAMVGAIVASSPTFVSDDLEPEDETLVDREVDVDEELEGDEEDEDAFELAGVWGTVESAIDLETFRPKLVEGTEVEIFTLRWGDDYAMVAKADRSAHYELQAWEGELVRSFDGSRTVGEIIVDHLETSGDLDVPAVAGLIEALRRVGIFEPAPIDLPEILSDRLDSSSSGRRRLRAFVKELRVSWVGADRLVRTLYERGLRVFFRRWVFVACLLVGLAGFTAFVTDAISGRHQLLIGSASLETVILIALGFVLTAAHEIGHAATLIHFDRRVLSAGFLLYYGSPAFFVETSDGQMLSRGPRMLQAFAGPFAEFTLAGISALLLVAFPEAFFANLLFKFSVLNYYVIFLNLIPLLELDGYWILSDAIEVPNLRPRSIAFIKREMWQKLFRRERFTLQEIGLGAYGVVGIAFTLLTSLLGLILWKEVFGSLVVDLWQQSLGTRILMIVLILFFTGPAIRGLITLGKALARRIRAVWRRVRFRAETSWRVEAAEAIDSLPAFHDIDVEVLNDLAGRVRLTTFAGGDTVFRQGDPADAFYVIRRGTVAVEDRDPETGDTRTLRVLEMGDAFGELGLLTGAPRQATVRARKDIEVFRVDKNAFDRLLANEINAPSFAPTMQAYAELRSLPPFATLGSADLEMLLDHGEFVALAPGEIVVRAGDPGDAFYVVSSGHARVSKDGQALADIGPGDHFGEIALLEDVPRTATVTATAPTRAFRLDRDGFDAVVRHAFGSGAIRRAGERVWER